jgi:hypothetical protein
MTGPSTSGVVFVLWDVKDHHQGLVTDQALYSAREWLVRASI